MDSRLLHRFHSALHRPEKIVRFPFSHFNQPFKTTFPFFHFALHSMVHIQNRLSTGMEVLQFFTMRDWKFVSDNFENIQKHMSPDELYLFNFDTKNTGDEWEYLKISLLGARQYCVKDPLSTLPKARLQLKM